ncbi:hypothetical protein PAMA_017164 [Pampus argenteus]
MYPMIEVANPSAEGDQPTMLVYRTWTMEDVKKALEGMPSHKEDIDLFIESMENVRKAYHLNGTEVQQIWMTALGSNWSHVRGDWNPKLDDAVLKPNDGKLTNRINALAQRARIRFTKRANYVEINRVKQKEDEPFEEYQIRMTKVFKANSGLHDDNNDAGPYRQQLKNALHAGSREPIRGWVERHNIRMRKSSTKAAEAVEVLEAEAKDVEAVEEDSTEEIEISMIKVVGLVVRMKQLL